MLGSLSKRYVKALAQVQDDSALNDTLNGARKVASALRIERFRDILSSKSVSYEQKLELILGAAENKNQNFVNFTKLLLKNGRVELMPFIAKEISQHLSLKSGNVGGRLVASFEVPEGQKNELEKKMSALLHKNISLSYENAKEGYDGLKVSIDDLGVEVEFDRKDVARELIGHILASEKL